MKWLIVVFMISVIVLSAVTVVYLIVDMIAEGRGEPDEENRAQEFHGRAEEFESRLNSLPKEQRALYESIRKYALGRKAESVRVNEYEEYRLGGKEWLRLKIEGGHVMYEALWPDCNPEHYVVE